VRGSPRSLMFMTPEALVLPLRFDSLVSLTSMPWTAESTLVSGSDMLEMIKGIAQESSTRHERVSKRLLLW
jgi:hypothetical protein